MDFDLTEEQVMFRNMAKAFAEREILPVTAEDDRNAHYRPEIIQKMAPLGLLAAPIPEEYGGLGVDNICYALICEEIAHASPGVFTTALTVHTSLFQLALLQAMNEEQKKKYFPRTTKGELLGCFALTEPNVGSDAASMETSAVQKGDHWVLNGNKMWISSGGVADLALSSPRQTRARHTEASLPFSWRGECRAFPVGTSMGKWGCVTLTLRNLFFRTVRYQKKTSLDRLATASR
jgi:alkylation response protein AidB-like acyl-CoA dehydrogenase